MSDKPTRALRNVAPEQQDAEAERTADCETEPPAEIGRHDAGIEKQQRSGRAGRSAEPEAAVNNEINAAAIARRDELVDCEIDRRVFTTDAKAGQRAAKREAHGAEGQGREQHADEVDRECDVEDQAEAEAVGQA